MLSYRKIGNLASRHLVIRIADFFVEQKMSILADNEMSFSTFNLFNCSEKLYMIVRVWRIFTFIEQKVSVYFLLKVKKMNRGFYALLVTCKVWTNLKYN